MTFALTLTTALIMMMGILIPVRREQRAKRRREFQKDLRLFQLKAVRDHYNLLDEYSYSEILDRYHVTDAYNRMRIRD